MNEHYQATTNKLNLELGDGEYQYALTDSSTFGDGKGWAVGRAVFMVNGTSHSTIYDAETGKVLTINDFNQKED